MVSRTLFVLGCAIFVGSMAGVVAVLAGFANESAAVTTVGGLAAGAVGGRALLPLNGLADRMSRRVSVAATILPLFGLIGWASWVGWQNGLNGRYAVAMGGILLALIGWVTVVQAGQNAASATAIRRGETLAELPRTSLVFGTDLPWPWSLLGPVTGLLGVVAGAWGYLNSGSVFFLFFVLAGLAYLAPSPEHTTRVTEEGLVSENYLGPLPIGTKFTSWDEITGCEVDGGTLTIATKLGLNFTYDTAAIDDLDRVQSVLDEYATGS
ncbi:hypothetical protein [Haloarcula laminariae]|uniref:hypothetical protein n=1 Tax=Haloarcula laminariae TaxID=2961577 RepID=UPI0021C8B0BB|nr:hypothetical protein [Halomicroarcula laminariae]